MTDTVKHGKNKGRKALYSPMWCSYTNHDTKRLQRKITAISKGE